MFIKIVIIALSIAYAGVNLFTAKTHSAREMRGEFIKGQCVVGAIFANVFYAPAWALKLLKGVVVAAIK